VKRQRPQDCLTRAIADSLTQLGDLVRDSRSDMPRIAVAVSGGLDSTALAIYAAKVARQRGVALHCFHIHHGLQTLADRWRSQTHDLARILDIPCHSLRVNVMSRSSSGVEAAARAARYDGLRQLAQHVGVRHILLGHHRDDQAETVLLRLLRGSGPQGLAAMRMLAEKNDLVYVRPFLGLDRRVLQQAFACWSRAGGWPLAQDPSNDDARHARSALRVHLAPALDVRWPAWRMNLARHAQLSGEMHAVLQEVARQDFAALTPSGSGTSFALAAWRLLSPARQALVLRYWLALHGLQMPTQRRLHDLLRQLRSLHALGHDRHMRVRHDQAWIVCMRGRVCLLREPDADW